MRDVPVSVEGYPSAERIKNYSIRQVQVHLLHCKIYCEKGEGFDFELIPNSPAYRFLKEKKAKDYEAYYSLIKEKHGGQSFHSTETFLRLMENLEKDGYNKKKLIICQPCIFGLVILDGMHRAAWIYHKNPDAIIPVLVTSDI